MNERLLEKVLTYIQKLHMIEPGDKVLVGLSGGADSVCLFYMLLNLGKKFSFSIEAAHVNHGLRDNALRDEEFARELCKSEGVPFHCHKADVSAVADEEHLSVEEAGRKVRYSFFARLMEKTGANKIAVAHHKNDQAETILFHLSRGSGIEGLCGMKPVRDEVIRPLLCLTREEIELYLSETGAAYVTDETNADKGYSRNRIRLDVLPQLEEICRGATEHIASTGDMVLQAADYLQSQIDIAMENCADVSGLAAGRVSLSCSKVQMLHDYLQGEVVRRCMFLLAGSKQDISKVHIEMVRNLMNMQVGSKSDLPGEIEAVKSYDSILFGRKNQATSPEESFCVQPDEELLLRGVDIELADGRVAHLKVMAYEPDMVIPTKTYTKWLDYDKISEPIVIRTPKENDYFYFNHKNKKYVKDYMVNEKIPFAQRKRSLLVASGSHMLYFIGKRISDYVKIDESTKRILEIVITGG